MDLPEHHSPLMCCPRCGASRFYLDLEPPVFLSLAVDGEPVDMHPVGERVALERHTVLFCIACPWAGVAAELHMGKI